MGLGNLIFRVRAPMAHERSFDTGPWPAAASGKNTAEASNAHRVCTRTGVSFLRPLDHQGIGGEVFFHAAQGEEFAVIVTVFGIAPSLDRRECTAVAGRNSARSVNAFFNEPSMRQSSSISCSGGAKSAAS